MSAFERLGRRTRYAIVGVAALAAVVFGVCLWIVLGPGPMDFAHDHRAGTESYSGPDPTGPPPELAEASLIERGKYLSRAADCEACHTAPGGTPFTGGLAFVLPFGTLYSTNITPDRATGIGDYSDTAFLNALHKGIRRNGAPLYPAMPYVSYAYITDKDGLAIKAYLFSLVPVHTSVPQNTLTFPFNQRWLMSIWSFLFNPDKRFAATPAQSGPWNRGAYLVEGLAHCGECHTPRNLFQALNNRRKFAGSVVAGWQAYNITNDGVSGIGAFSDDDLAKYLATGHAERHGTAAGPMDEAVEKSFRYMTASDISAMVVYLRSVPGRMAPDLPAPRAAAAPDSPRHGMPAQFDQGGEAVFEGACVSCHGWSGVSPLMRRATLTGARAVNDPTGINVIQIVLSGADGHAGGGAGFMPAFGATYSDTEVAAVVNYMTARFGARPSAVRAEDVARLRAAR